MQVEVNEENIVRYNLVQLTGNTKEALLTAAMQAEKNGYVLTCRIPEPSDDVLQMNIFEGAQGDVPSDEELEAFYHQANPITHKEEGKKQPGREINVVPGEVIETHIEED
jgi:hypothetical protein